MPTTLLMSRYPPLQGTGAYPGSVRPVMPYGTTPPHKVPQQEDLGPGQPLLNSNRRYSPASFSPRQSRISSLAPLETQQQQMIKPALTLVSRAWRQPAIHYDRNAGRYVVQPELEMPPRKARASVHDLHSANPPAPLAQMTPPTITPRASARGGNVAFAVVRVSRPRPSPRRVQLLDDLFKHQREEEVSDIPPVPRPASALGALDEEVLVAALSQPSHALALIRTKHTGLSRIGRRPDPAEHG